MSEHDEATTPKTKPSSLEQRLIDQRQATPAAPARLVDPEQTSSRRAQWSAIESRYLALRGITNIGRQCGKRRLGHPVKFELTEHTRQAIDDYLKMAG